MTFFYIFTFFELLHTLSQTLGCVTRTQYSTPITTNVAWNAWSVCLLSQCSNETADVILLRPIGLWPILRKL